MIRRVIYGPPNWLVSKWDTEDRRAFGFWTIVFAVVGTVLFGKQVLWVSILSVIALVPNFASETPVQVEDDA